MVRKACLVLLGALLISCGKSGAPENPVVGVITKIDGDRIEVEWGDSQHTEFLIADQSVTREHLTEHMRSRWAVKVSFQTVGDSFRAVLIEDATPTPTATTPSGPQPYSTEQQPF